MHGGLAVLVPILFGGAVALELVAAFRDRPGIRDWARGLLAAGIVTVLLTAFTGLDVRKGLPGEGTPAVIAADRHVLWAIVLMVPLAGALVARLRMGEVGLDRRPWLAPALDAVAAILALSIFWMGAGLR